MADQRPPRLAVLIDADNTSPRLVDDLFEEIAKLGEASVRRIYGDFSGTRLKGWADVMPRHAILPYQNFANTTGKNASDIALVIDAMDLLHSGRVEGFCLVSSDSDFTRLAARLREQGVQVYGFGRRTTPGSFRQACNRFIFTENLGAEGTADTAVPQQGIKPNPAGAVPLLRKAFDQTEGDEGWVPLSTLGQRIFSLASDFDPRSYGLKKLSDLVEQSGAFELAREGKHLRVRLKPGVKAGGERAKSRRRAAADPA